jgi:hypothetical protein
VESRSLEVLAWSSRSDMEGTKSAVQDIIDAVLLGRQSVPLTPLAHTTRFARDKSIPVTKILGRGKPPVGVTAKSLVWYWALEELGTVGTVVAKLLGVGRRKLPEVSNPRSLSLQYPGASIPQPPQCGIPSIFSDSASRWSIDRADL